MKKIWTIIFSSLLGIVLFMPKTIFADSETIQNFDSKIIAHQDGTFNVIETINYNFGDNNKHGIYRDIPTITKVGELYRQIKINVADIKRDNSNENYSVSNNGSQVSIKIGDPNKTISGNHVYLISYIVENGIGSNYPDHDEIYWNVTGNGWKIPILSASTTVSTDFGVSPDKAACFTGSVGSTEKNCILPSDFPASPITLTTPLSSYQGLTVVAGFPVNTFPKSILSNNTPTKNYVFSDSNSAWISYLFLVPAVTFNLILAPILLVWYFKHKNKNHFGPVSVNFDIPKDSSKQVITPAEAGAIDNARLDKNDVIATIFDLAIRKYIKIEQVNKKKTLGIFGGGDDYQIKKLKSYDNVNNFEKLLLNRLFDSGDEMKISSLGEDFYRTFQNLDTELFKSLVSKNYYAKNPKTQKAALAIAGVAALFLLGPLLGTVLIFLAFKLNGRTTKGDEIDFKIDGLKLFLKNMSREYKWQAENLYIVEKYIPYAMALGYIDEFMKQLKVIYPNYQPTWYTGYSPFYINSSNMISSFSSGFTSVAPSSSSGFSSGGSSGGGGGGGGGGSW